MGTLVKIAVRNLTRYKRRTLLTASLIAVGVLGVVVFGAASAAFKSMMIGQMTDSMLGHLQIHHRGYVAAIDNLPLTLNLDGPQIARIEEVLRSTPEVEAYSLRIKFGGLFSNYAETTSIRLNGVRPDEELATVPLLASRIKQGDPTIRPGYIIIPELLASGMQVAPGDTVVVIATNKEGSVNAAQLRVGAVIEGVTGPGGRDGYLHMDDAAALLRMEDVEVSEVAVRLKDFDRLHEVTRALEAALGVGGGRAGGQAGSQPGAPGSGQGLEVHTWEALSPFYNIAVMIDILTYSVKFALVAIVLIAVMNVMLMSVYERVREIGTIAAMGTLPGRILSMFVIEGFSLGVVGVLIGNLAGVATIVGLRAAGLRFAFGRQTDLLLAPRVDWSDILMVSAIVVIVAVAGSVQPAFKAARMEPVEALRHG